MNETTQTDARLDEIQKLWSLDFTDAYNGGYLTEKGRDYLRKRIAELMEEKETK